jgi:hypothetical protein
MKKINVSGHGLEQLQQQRQPNEGIITMITQSEFHFYRLMFSNDQPFDQGITKP